MDEFEELQRRIEFDRQRRPLEEQARQAQERGDLEQSAALWRQSRDLAIRGGDEISRWYVEGQLADVLIKANQVPQATQLLEASVAAGNDVPFAHRLLVELCMQQRRYADACRIQRNSWRSISARAQANGMPPIDPSPQIISFANWWKDTDSADPISLAEQWADEAGARGAWFAVRHERAAMLERRDEGGAALDLYLDLIQQGSKHEATYARAMLLLERAKRGEEALALARSIAGLGLSASLEEQARKRILKLETKTLEKRSPRRKQASAPKAQVPPFTIRTGEAWLRWLGQVEVKGGVSSVISAEKGAFATGGTPPGIWRIEEGTEGAQTAVYLRAIDKRSRLYLDRGSVLITDEGTVNDGSARIELVAADWTTAATVTLPGVTSEVAVTTWGVAVGCRAGGLYAVGWDGLVRWRFELPTQSADDTPFGRACPYYVSSARDSGRVVFSSYAKVFAVTDDGALAWQWNVPPPPAHQLRALVSFQLPTASVSSITATRDGGAWVGTQAGGVFRLDGQGRVVWTTQVGANTAQLVAGEQDRLVAITHAGGVAMVDASGSLQTVVASKRCTTLSRSPDGQLLLVSEGKLLQVLDNGGEVRAAVEFARPILGVGFVRSSIVVAAGKLETFGAVL